MIITGTSGNDTLTGTAGDDTIDALDGVDSVNAAAGNDTVFGGAGIDFLDGGLGNDEVHGGDGDDSISGGGDSDTLFGEGGNDRLNQLGNFGQNGTSVADGGVGNDTFSTSWWTNTTITTGGDSDKIILWNGDNSHKVTVTDFTAGAGGDVLDISFMLSSSLTGWNSSTNPFATGFLRLAQNGTDTDLQWDHNGATGGAVWTTFVTLQNVTASSLTLANFFPGYPPDGSAPVGQIITGTPGNDTLTGTAGDDSIHALGGSDWVDAGPGNDMVHGDDGNDRLIFSGGSNSGLDTWNGGNGTDVGDFSAFGAAVWVDLNYSADPYEAWTRDNAGVTSGNWRPIADITNVEDIITTAFNDQIWGNAGDNRISYNEGLDQVDGRGGSDTIDFSSFDAAVWLDLAYTADPYEGWTRDNAGLTSENWRPIADISNVENVATTAFDDQIWGNAADNRIIYNEGFDQINGRGGSDTVDLSSFDSAVWLDLNYTELPAEAWTRDNAGLTSANWRPIADISNVENVATTAFDDQIWGNAADNRISYNKGLDQIDGRGGSDTIDLSSFGSAVWLDLSYTADPYEGWTRDNSGVTSGNWRPIADVSNVENLVTTEFDDQIWGNAADNRISYIEGLDQVDGRGGSDTIDFSSFGSAVWLDLSYTADPYEGWTRDNSGVTSGNWRPIADVSNVENLIGTANSDHFGGNGNANRIDGGAGFDEVSFAGLQSNYSAQNLGGGSWQVTNLANPNDVDSLLNIEMVVFGDGFLLV
jgi:Ca2+-binding RTX toxin-like protein